MVRRSYSTLISRRTVLKKRPINTKVYNVMNVKDMVTSEQNVRPFSRSKRKDNTVSWNFDFLQIVINPFQPILKLVLSRVLSIKTGGSLKFSQDKVYYFFQSLPLLFVAVFMNQVVPCLNQLVQLLKNILTHIC